MMFLDFHNNTIEDALIRLYYRIWKPRPLDMRFHDFSGIFYHLLTPDIDKLELLRLSIQWDCWAQLVQYGAMEVLEREYSPWIITPPEEGFDFTLQFTLEELVGDNDPDDAIRNVALLRRNALSGAFERAFNAQAQAREENNPNFNPSEIEFMLIDCHRDERMYIRHHQDWTSVIIGIALDDLDEADRVFVRMTFEELTHRSRLPQCYERAPHVSYANLGAPPEIQQRDEVLHDSSQCRAYITFRIFPRHIPTKKARDQVISQRMIFRNYLLYHIKSAKGYMHIRMRRRLNEQLRQLSRARQDYVPPPRGRTFFRRPQ